LNTQIEEIDFKQRKRKKNRKKTIINKFCLFVQFHLYNYDIGFTDKTTDINVGLNET